MEKLNRIIINFCEDSHFSKRNLLRRRHLSKLEQLHKAYMETKEPEENYNFDDHKPKIEENEFNTWQPVARDIEFEKQIAKLKAMQKFNKGR